jgi:hypothetical protein
VLFHLSLDMQVFSPFGLLQIHYYEQMCC